MIRLLIAYILNIIDYLFTIYWVKLYGTDIEANPVGQWMFEHRLTGFIKVVVMAALFAFIGYEMKRYAIARYASYLLLTVFSLLVVYHVGIAVYFAI